VPGLRKKRDEAINRLGCFKAKSSSRKGAKPLARHFGKMGRKNRDLREISEKAECDFRIGTQKPTAGSDDNEGKKDEALKTGNRLGAKVLGTRAARGDGHAKGKEVARLLLSGGGEGDPRDGRDVRAPLTGSCSRETKKGGACSA